MKFLLNVNCNNEAFIFSDDESGNVTSDSASIELARILREIASKIENGADYNYFQTIRDINDNDVGRYAIKPDDYK